MRRLIVLLALAAVLAAAALAGAQWWTTQPLTLDKPVLRFDIPHGSSVRSAATRIADAGVRVPAQALFVYFRWAGRDGTIKSGEYEITAGVTPQSLLGKLQRGEQIRRTVTIVEGWTFAQMRRALGQLEHIRHETEGMSAQQIMAALGRPELPAEGRFFPDTYHYTRGSSDLDLMRQALEQMDRRLEQAWAARSADLPLASPQEALILASIVEKETGLHTDRAEVAGVFANRLARGMLLQTDPTVIYGLGDAFDGRLTRSQLRADTPFNTYTRKGLPPTPIALPGAAALQAAVQPAATSSLYFVARGDGSSHFSRTLGEHNRAVYKYQRAPRKVQQP